MQLSRPFRLPLSTGATPINLALGTGLIGFFGATPVFVGSLLPQYVAWVSGVLIAVWFFALMALPFVARKQRASDVLLGPSGVSIYGGAYAGQQLQWSELCAAPAMLTPATHPGDCCLTLPGSRNVITSDPEERASLASLARTLNALAAGYAEAQAPAIAYGEQSAIPVCPNCGAPLTPSSLPSVKCLHCGVDAQVPERLRIEVEQLQTLTAARTDTQRALGVLSRWPSARRVNRVLAIAALPLVLGWPVSGALASEYFQYHDVFCWRDVGVLFVSTAALTLGLCFWLTGQAVHRHAFGLVVASFHAVRIADDGLGCHNCGAPLGTRPDEPLVACAFCRADNVVLGLALAPRVAAETAQAESLDAVLRTRLDSLRTWRYLSLAAALLIATGSLFLIEPLERAFSDPGPRHAPVDRAWSYPGPAR